MGYPIGGKININPAEDQPPAEHDNEMDEMVRDAAVDGNWVYDPKRYHDPDWIEVPDETVEKVDRLAEIHGDPACPSVTTISDASIYYLNSCGDRFVDMMKDHFGHGPDNSTWWTHTWEAEIITDEDREELRELLDYFETELDHEYYIPMGFVGKIKIDAER